VPGALVGADREIKKAAIGSRYVWATKKCITILFTTDIRA